MPRDHPGNARYFSVHTSMSASGDDLPERLPAIRTSNQVLWRARCVERGVRRARITRMSERGSYTMRSVTWTTGGADQAHREGSRE